MKGSARLLAPLVAAFALLAALPAHAWPNWLPENVNKTYGERVDGLYWGIYIIVAIFFFLTEGLLLFCLVAFRARAGHKAKYMHGSNVMEALWTGIPALILIGIGLAQADSWSDIRMNFPSEKDKDVVVLQTFPKQFDWQYRYPGPDGAFGGEDDRYTGYIHIPLGKKVVVKLSSSDVIHSFFVPHARVKLDAVPGMLGRVWFTMDKYAIWDLKANKMVLLTPEEIANKKIGWSGPAAPGRAQRGYLFHEDDADAPGAEIKHGLKKYSYTLVPEDRKTVNVYYQGKIVEVPVGEVDGVFHRYEIACAELCGLGHFTMRSYVYVDPPEIFAAWYEAVPTGQVEDTVKRWKEYWDTPHPTWNKVIE